MGRAALKTEGERDPSRAALAEAIGTLAQRRALHANVQAGHDRASAILSAAYGDLDAAEQAIKDAGANRRDHIVASIMRGDDLPANDALRKAEAAKADAEERISAAREAREALAVTLADEARSVGYAETTASDLVGAILWEVLPEVLAEAEPLRRRLAALTKVAQAITRSGPFMSSADDPRRPYQRQAETMSQVIHGPESDAAYAEWVAIAKRLETDPDAPLPSTDVPRAATATLRAGV